MGTVTITLEDNTETNFRNYVYKEYGKSKGVLGKAINEALNKWLETKKQKEIAESAIKRMKKGYNLGKFKLESRDELHER